MTFHLWPSRFLPRSNLSWVMLTNQYLFILNTRKESRHSLKSTGSQGLLLGDHDSHPWRRCQSVVEVGPLQLSERSSGKMKSFAWKINRTACDGNRNHDSAIVRATYCLLGHASSLSTQNYHKSKSFLLCSWERYLKKCDTEINPKGFQFAWILTIYNNPVRFCNCFNLLLQRNTRSCEFLWMWSCITCTNEIMRCQTFI